MQIRFIIRRNVRVALRKAFEGLAKQSDLIHQLISTRLDWHSSRVIALRVKCIFASCPSNATCKFDFRDGKGMAKVWRTIYVSTSWSAVNCGDLEIPSLRIRHRCYWQLAKFRAHAKESMLL